MKILHRLWQEQDGVLISLEMILAAIMLVFGMVAGMQVLRDAAAMELADLGMAIGAINNSFTIAGIAGADGVTSVAGSSFTDATDTDDAGDTQTASTSVGLLLGQAPPAGGG